MPPPPPDDSQRSGSARGPRLVGRVVDPAADDGLALTGPGAPGAPSLNRDLAGSDHPVKARLLARARLARGEGTEEDRLLVAQEPRSPSAASPATANPSPGGPSAASPSAASPSAASPSAASPPAPAGVTAEGAVPALNAMLPQVVETVPAEGRADPGPASDRSVADGGSTEEPATSGLTPPARATSHGTQALAPTGEEESFAPRAGLTPPPGAVASELDRIAGRGGPLPPHRAGLSPNMAAALSALLGLTVVGSIGVFARPLQLESAASSSRAPAKPEAPPDQPLPPAAEAPVRQKVQGPWRVEHDSHQPGHRILSGKIGKQAFLRAIQDAGLPKSEAYRVYGALKQELDLDHCQSADTFRALVRGRTKELVAFEYEKSKEEIYQVKADPNGRLTGQRLDLKVERNQIRRAFVHDGGSVEDSARRGGFDPGLTSVLEQAFRGHLSLSELARGDRLRVIAQELTVLGEFGRYTGIEALEIVRLGKPGQRIYYYPHASEGGYFDESGKAPYEGGWRKPIPGAPVTSKFNMQRLHPVLKKVMPHTGTDFGAPTGTAIGATAPGIVSYIGYAGPSGNLVKVKHDGGYESGYAHLSRFEKGLQVGDRVERLQTVGYCGSTGRSTGPHLHFTMKKDGKYIDPESLNLDGLRVLPPSHRPQFAEVRAKYDPILDAIPLPPALASPLAPPQAAAPAPSTAENPSEDSEANPMMADESEGPATEPLVDGARTAAPPSGPPPAAPAPTSPGAPAASVGASSIFLSDEELLKLQNRSDDGEVSE